MVHQGCGGGGCPRDLPTPFFVVPKCNSRVHMGVCFWNPGQCCPECGPCDPLQLPPFAGGQLIRPQLAIKASGVNLFEGTQFSRWKRKMLDIGSLLGARRSYKTSGS